MGPWPSLNILQKRARRALARAPSPSEHIRNRQLQHPPRYDHQNTLLPALRRSLPPNVDVLFKYDVLWAGEIGLMTANAEIRTLLPSEEYAIEFYSGAKFLLYSVARALAAATRIHFSPPTPVVEPALSKREVAALIGKVLMTYATTQQLPPPPHHPAQEEQKKLAHDFATSAELFLLAHEVGHAWIADKSKKAAQTSLKGYNITWEEEFVSDQLAITWLLHDSLVRGKGPRMVYAGAEFAMRVLECLEILGTPFEGTHPNAKLRLDVLRVTSKQLCDKTKVSFDQVRTIAIANDEFLEEIVRRIQGVDPTPSQDRTRVRSKLLVLLDECANGIVDEEFAIAEMMLFWKYSSDQVMVAAAHDAYEHYKISRPDAAQLTVRLMARMPEPLPSLFALGGPITGSS